MWIDRILQAIIGGAGDLLHRLFPAHTGPTGWAFVAGAAIISLLAFLGMQQLKPRGRRALIIAVTFLAGLYYVLEFFVPVTVQGGSEGNALTPLLPVVNDVYQILAAVALGLGIYSLCLIHGRTIVQGRPGQFYSFTFFIAMIAMAWIRILYKTPGHDKIAINGALHDILFKGGLVALDSTMFSIIAFYIASAAYRAFRIRNVEATLLMGAAFIVLLGQVYIGQVLTSWLPSEGMMANLRFETLSDWLLTRVNAPAVRAIGFGLGVGLLATSLRIWLSLERGSYFDKEM